MSAGLSLIGLGMAVKNAAALLEDFQRAGIAVEVTHRSKRRLFHPPGPTRGRGRPRLHPDDDRADNVMPPMPPAR
jgi:hypothetical protein